jgi:ABC-type branched-subunit amino acid transport system substrate-binding protein
MDKKPISSLLALAALLAAGCARPNLDDTKWYCKTSSDCGSGYACVIKDNSCTKADTGGKNGVFDGELKFGQTAALTTGVATDLGTGMKNGTLAYFNYVNTKKGGVWGRQLTLVSKDDGYEPNNALNNMKAFTEPDKNVFGVIATVGTPTAAVTVPYAKDHQVFFYGAFTGAGVLREDPPARYIWNFRASYKQETANLVKYLAAVREPKIDPKNIACLPQGNDSNGTIDPYGQSGFDGVASALSAYGIQKADIFYWTYQRNTLDVAPAVAKFLGWLSNGRVKDADGNITAAIVMVPTADPAAQFLQALTDQIQNIKAGRDIDAKYGSLSEAQKAELAKVSAVVFTSVSFIGTDKFAQNLKGMGSYNTTVGGKPVTKTYCDGAIVSEVVPPPSSGASAVNEYREHLAALDKSIPPGFVSLEGYLAARVLVTALEVAGRDLTPETFIDFLGTQNNIDIGLGVPLGFNTNDHQASKSTWAVSFDKDCNYVALALTK